MTEAEITEYIKKTFPGVDVVVASKENDAPEISWGDTFFFYDPKGDIPSDRRFPFATIVTKDYPDFDTASNLDRPGVFRLNIGLRKETYDRLFGSLESEPDFAELDKLMPHPIYGKMHWVSVINPSPDTFESQIKLLLQEAYDRAAQKSSNQ